MKFNFDNNRPIYIQLVEQIRLLILSGYFKLGDRLPSVREFALIAKVNPNTVQKALQELEDEKLIYTDRTNGKYITDDKNLIKKLKLKIANDFVLNYLGDMNKIGFNKEDAIKYLIEYEGERKWAY